MKPEEVRKELWSRDDGYRQWVAGELGWIVLYQGDESSYPAFDRESLYYTFRRKSPPTLRPFTWDELVDRLDWWFRRNDCEGGVYRCTFVSVKEGRVQLGDWQSARTLASNWEYSSDLKVWQACGVMEGGE